MLQNLDLLEPHNLVPPGVFTLDGLLKYGEQHKQCPYFSARRMVRSASSARIASLMDVDAFLQCHYLFLPLFTRSEDC